MSRRKQPNRSHKRRRREIQRRKNKTLFQALLDWLIPEQGLFAKDRFHGNIKWRPEQLAQQAMIWAWQETKKVTDAFEQTLEMCGDLSIEKAAKTYTAFINALDRYRRHVQPAVTGALPVLGRGDRGAVLARPRLGVDRL